MEDSVINILLDIKADIGGLKKNVSGLKADVSDIKADISDIKERVGNLETDMAEVKSTVNSLLCNARIARLMCRRSFTYPTIASCRT